MGPLAPLTPKHRSALGRVFQRWKRRFPKQMRKIFLRPGPKAANFYMFVRGAPGAPDPETPVSAWACSPAVETQISKTGAKNMFVTWAREARQKSRNLFFFFGAKHIFVTWAQNSDFFTKTTDFFMRIRGAPGAPGPLASPRRGRRSGWAHRGYQT